MNANGKFWRFMMGQKFQKIIFFDIFKKSGDNMISIKKDRDQNYQFSVKTGEGQPLLDSVVFSDKSDMENTVANLGAFVGHQNAFERKTDHDGKFHFSLKDRNGQIIGNSQLYDSEAGLENGIKNLKKNISLL